MQSFVFLKRLPKVRLIEAKKEQGRKMNKFTLLLFALTMFSWAGNDPSIKGEQRNNIQAAMGKHVKQLSADGVYHIYDARQKNKRSICRYSIFSTC